MQKQANPVPTQFFWTIIQIKKKKNQRERKKEKAKRLDSKGMSFNLKGY